MAGARFPPAALLSVVDVTMRFGGIIALGGVSFDVGAQPDLRPDRSQRLRQDHAVQLHQRHLPPLARRHPCSTANRCPALPRHRMAGLGIGRTFQNLALFRSMTVRNNMLVGAHHLGRTGFIADALRLPATAREEAEMAHRVEVLLDLLDLREVADVPIESLPFGTQQARRTGARADRAAEAAAARRTGRRPQPRRGRRPGDSCSGRSAKQFEPHHPAGRTSHEPGDERLRQGRRARIRHARSPTARRTRCATNRK